jgi:hypothetical protein
LGRLESLALPGESYKLAFTTKLFAEVFQRDGQPLLPAPADVLAGQGTDKGGYVDLDKNGCWWIPAGRIYFSPNSAAVPADEQTEARRSFFTPRRHCDPFGSCTTVDFDHWLLPSRTTDALGNTVQAENDFRVLQPKLMTDPNGNRTALAFDPLGLVTATAVMGKEGETDPENIGDTLDDPTTIVFKF